MDNEKRIWDFFIAKGYTPYGAAGVMGNLYAESALNPKNLQNSSEKKLGMSDEQYTTAVDNGSYTNFARDSGGYGLAQWTYWSRKQNLLNFAKQQGKSIGDLDMQLEFLHKELLGYKGMTTSVQQATSIKQASDFIVLNFERPASVGASASEATKNATLSKRQSYGQKYYDKYSRTAVSNAPKASYSAPAALDRLLAIALAEEGYLEKKTNAQLDDKTANAGSNNWTKYARDLDALGVVYNGKKNGYSWCDVFVDWCFITTFGLEIGIQMLYQPKKGLGAGCTYSARYFKNNNALYTTPQKGDQIFFGKSNGSCTHTGIVYNVDNNYVYTIEGNTSGASGVVANGGGVCKKRYALGNSNIYGYGRPNWALVPTEAPIESTNTEEEEEMTQAQFNQMLTTYLSQLAAQPVSYTEEQNALDWAQANGIMKGNGNSNLMPKSFISRGEVAILLQRLAQMVGK